MPQYKKVFDVGTYAGVSGYTRVGIPTLRTPGAGGKQVAKSLRFRSANSAYLNRTMAMQASRTLSMWIKRGAISVSGTDYNILFNDGSTGDFFLVIGQASSAYANKLRFTDSSGTPLYSAIVLSDPSTWYHIVVTQSSTATSIYINGVLSSSYSRAGVAISSSPMKISHTNTTQSFDGYMADVNFIDGQALTPSSFGEYNSDNIWVPKAYSGSYGTNGFYLDFSDVALTSGSNAGYGKDTSGNGNYWNTNGLSVTAGTTYDSMYDSPTDYDNSVYGAGNYAVLNPLTQASTAISNGNLAAIASGFSYADCDVTFSPEGLKGYFEFTISTTDARIGFIPKSVAITGSNYTNSSGFVISPYYNSVDQGNSRFINSYFTGSTANDIIGCAFDFTGSNRNVWWSRNGTWGTTSGGVGNPATGANPALTATNLNAGPYRFYNAPSNATTVNFNFGQRNFNTAPPSGFSALNTKNITRPTDANMWFYGDTPDLMWIKNRTLNPSDHSLTDTVRGVGLGMSSNQATAEQGAQDVAEMNKFGMTLIGASSRTTAASNSFVYWGWKAGGATTSTNTQGSVTSQVSANVSAGFSIVSYTGTGANATVGHGLSAAPKFIIVKNRDDARSWNVWHTTIATTDFLLLETTAAPATDATKWNSLAPTATVLNLGSAGGTNASGQKHVAYCFAPIAGYSSFGSYTGNGSTTGDGPFIYTGFRVKWLMVKRYDTGSTSNWQITHTGGSYYNGSGQGVYANLTQAEGTGVYHDLLSNGFKVKTNDGDANTLNGTYIYAAFAEVPFKIARAR